MGYANVWRNQELEDWIVLFLYVNERKLSHINPSIVINESPESLAIQIPNDNDITLLLHQMEYDQKLVRRAYGNFLLSTNGCLYIRKYLARLKEKAQDDKYISDVLNDIEGTDKSKKAFKKKLKEIKDLALDEFFEEYKNWIIRAGKDALFQTIRVLAESSPPPSG